MAQEENSDSERQQLEFQAMEAIIGQGGPDTFTCDGSQWIFKIAFQPQVIATLELHLPDSYPSTLPPTPLLHAPVADELVAEIIREMLDMYDGSEVAHLWLEHVRRRLGEVIQPIPTEGIEKAVEPNVAAQTKESVFIFTPSSTSFKQPQRRFGSDAQDEANRVELVHGEAFTPPGNSTFQAHCARVKSIGQVHWALCKLLQDKKIARASHNIFAYRLHDEKRGVLVKDNDDDGEDAAGGRLAALIELMEASDVLVVVSRWFGGTLLGPARFKYITNAAREILVQYGFGQRGKPSKKGRGR